jgi:hypothetical protein
MIGSDRGTAEPSLRNTIHKSIATVGGGILGLAAVVAFLVAHPREASQAGLGLNTVEVFDQHSRGTFHLGGQHPPAEVRDVVHGFGAMPKLLWLGASQLYGINAYQPGHRSAAYQVFDALIPDNVATVTVSLPLAFPEEHEIVLQYLLAREKVSGVVIGAVYGDMRHDAVRATVAQLLDDADTRRRIEGTEHGRRLVARAQIKETDKAATVPGPDRDAPSLMAVTEERITDIGEKAFRLETLRKAGRGWTILTLEDIRRYFESLRARYTRDLSSYRVPMIAKNYEANREAWREMMAAAKKAGTPMLVYIPPRPTDFFPFEPAGYEAFKRDIEQLAAQNSAAFVNLENVVPNALWGEVDLSFGFNVRDPFHFRAEGHTLLAQALLPHIRKHLIEGRGAP